jgi:beta-alanine--pyruvate transaminase
MQGPEYMVELFHGFTYSGHPLAVAAGLATLEVYKEEGLFERAKANEAAFAAAMMSLKGKPYVADIRPIGLMCGIDLEPRGGAAGVRGYEAIERMYHEHDVHVRVTMDTLIVSPPLIATERDFGEIRDRIAAMLAVLE